MHAFFRHSLRLFLFVFWVLSAQSSFGVSYKTLKLCGNSFAPHPRPNVATNVTTVNAPTTEAPSSSPASFAVEELLFPSGTHVGLQLPALGKGFEKTVYATSEPGLLIGIFNSNDIHRQLGQISQGTTNPAIGFLNALPSIPTPYLRYETAPQPVRTGNGEQLVLVSLMEEAVPISFDFHKRSIHRHSNDSLEAVLALGLQMTAAARALNHAGFFHADIKLDNILMLPENGESSAHFVLTDYGVMDLRDMPAEHNVRGTPSFMSPEQFQPGAPLGLESMLYSISVTLLEALYSREVFDSFQTSRRFANINKTLLSFAFDPQTSYARVRTKLQADVARDLQQNADRPSHFRQARASRIQSIVTLILSGLHPDRLNRLNLSVHARTPSNSEAHSSRIPIRQRAFYGQVEQLLSNSR